MATLSKFMCEYTVTANVNDRLRIDDVPTTGGWIVITIPPGRYRDITVVAAELKLVLDASASARTYTVTVSDTTGIMTISANGNWVVDWNTGTYGTTLRNDLGYTGSETVTANALVATNATTGNFFPSEPVETDDRPKPTGTDRFSADTYQQGGRSGVIATTGGNIKIYTRSWTFFLASTDLENYVTWLGHVAKGKSFAFYHDRTVAWPGSANEYDEYVMLAEGDRGIEYAPERVEAQNTVWHRASVHAQQYVAPTP